MDDMPAEYYHSEDIKRPTEEGIKQAHESETRPIQTLIESQDGHDENHQFGPSFFHYKRWIWVMFPWACMFARKKYYFSYTISRCYSSDTQYLSVAEEKVKQF
jgi:hypothetical protein